MAYAAGDQTYKWEGLRFPRPGYYWPPGAEMGDGLDALVSAFLAIGYTNDCTTGSALEPGYEKVALYVDIESEEPAMVRSPECTIWKYEIPIQDEFTIQARIGAVPIYTGVQHGRPYVWMLVDKRAAGEFKKFYLIGTGKDMAMDAQHYIGSFQLQSGLLVYHLFEAVGSR